MIPQGNEAGQMSWQRHEALCKAVTKTENKLELNIGTWNVCSLYRAGALNMLLTQLSAYKADIVALQEI
jgi:hypothetical protein